MIPRYVLLPKEEKKFHKDIWTLTKARPSVMPKLISTEIP